MTVLRNDHEYFEMAQFVREQYQDFSVFAAAAMRFLGYPITPMQADIAKYMAQGPRLSMVMAQRGEAKSTLAAIFGVWSLTQRPGTRTLIISAGGAQASEVALLIQRLILRWDLLTYLRPDKTMGDRDSREEFDVNYRFKPLDKSPSVACVGITSNLQGKRADLLIPDDIESTKNGLTAAMREHLKVLTREFTSINTDGKILYLGTPQTKDSVYNGLELRGFEIRIWPGRFPTAEELVRYGNRLAPFHTERIQRDPSLQTGGGIDGTRGQPADPDRFGESALQEKELDQGPEGFQLQYMLDTSLADEARQQLKLKDLVIANFDHDMLPEVVVYQTSPQYAVELPAGFAVPGAKLYYPMLLNNATFVPRGFTGMFVDPAGNGGDELSFAIGSAVGPYVHVLVVRGLQGGFSDENISTLLHLVKQYNVTNIRVEANGGLGLAEKLLVSELIKADLQDKVGVESVWSTGQKERRIIESLVGPMQRHRVVLHPAVLEYDVLDCARYSQEQRAVRSLFYQLENITTERQALPKDDRIDALAGLVRMFMDNLAQDEEEASAKRLEDEMKEFLRDPMGYGINPRRAGGTRARIKGVRR